MMPTDCNLKRVGAFFLKLCLMSNKNHCKPINVLFSLKCVMVIILDHSLYTSNFLEFRPYGMPRVTLFTILDFKLIRTVLNGEFGLENLIMHCITETCLYSERIACKEGTCSS